MLCQYRYKYICSATTNIQAGWSAEVEVEVESRFGDLSGTLLSTSPNLSECGRAGMET
jgi:hypothetical protein